MIVCVPHFRISAIVPRWVEDHTLVVPFVRTVDNLADFFTKPLGVKAFFPMRNAIMNVRT